MLHTSRTSPYYPSWVAIAPVLCAEIREGILARDLARVGAAMEQSTFAMHACALASAPALIYLRPATLAVFERVRSLRDEDGLSVWATADAGPHVKALCQPKDAQRVERALAEVPGVIRTIVAEPGQGVEIAS